jgi:hypothetical protein
MKKAKIYYTKAIHIPGSEFILIEYNKLVPPEKEFIRVPAELVDFKEGTFEVEFVSQNIDAITVKFPEIGWSQSKQMVVASEQFQFIPEE